MSFIVNCRSPSSVLFKSVDDCKSEERIMTSQRNKFPSLKSINRRVRRGPISIVAYLMLACASGILVFHESALAGPGKGGFKTQDLPSNADFLEVTGDAVTSDGLNGPLSYINGQDRVSCFIGRREGQFSLTTSNKVTSGRMLNLDNQGQYIPESCGNFNGLRVSSMTTARIDDGGVDLRYLGDVVEIPLWLNVHDDRQNFWHIQYAGVRVEPVAFGDDSNPTEWLIDTDCPDCSSANVSRVIDNQYVDAIDCGSFVLPFHLRVTLQ
jgi:hypothetical protein